MGARVSEVFIIAGSFNCFWGMREIDENSKFFIFSYRRIKFTLNFENKNGYKELEKTFWTIISKSCDSIRVVCCGHISDTYSKFLFYFFVISRIIIKIDRNKC